MKVLLDTHALYWWVRRDARLSVETRSAISAAATVLISAAVVWEMSIKHASGKWDEAGAVLSGLDRMLRDDGFQELPVTISHARAAARLPSFHKDPFDRVLIAQAAIEGATIVSSDRVFAAYAVPVLWA